MQVSNVLTLARSYLQTDNIGLTDSDGLNLANEALPSATLDLIKRGINAAPLVEAYLSATSGVGIYPWPDGVSSTWTPVSGSAPTAELLMVKVLVVNYKDTTEQNYIETTLVDAGNLPAGQSYMWLRQNQTEEKPLLDNRGATFEVFPAPTTVRNDNLTNFFYLFYFAVPTPFGSVSSSVGFPFNSNANVLALRIAMLASMRGNEEDQERVKGYASLLETELDTLENILKQGTQKSPQTQGIGWDGNQF